jgi:SAM-dependent methyltransferase
MVESDWQQYYDAHRGLRPHETLLTALMLFDREGAAPGLAIDLGCGNGRDSIELLKRGWRVHAIDKESAAIKLLVDNVKLEHRALLKAEAASIESANWAPANLINASLSLPFCRADAFPEVWHRISTSVLPGGRFAGHLLGNNDTWAGNSEVLTHTRAQVEDLLNRMDVEAFSESEFEGLTVSGQRKHWHIYQFVSRVRAESLS